MAGASSFNVCPCFRATRRLGCCRELRSSKIPTLKLNCNSICSSKVATCKCTSSVRRTVPQLKPRALRFEAAHRCGQERLTHEMLGKRGRASCARGVMRSIYQACRAVAGGQRCQIERLHLAAAGFGLVFCTCLLAYCPCLPRAFLIACLLACLLACGLACLCGGRSHCFKDRIL